MKIAQTQRCLVCLNEHVYTVTMAYINLSVGSYLNACIKNNIV